MKGPGPRQRGEIDNEIRALEDRAAEDLATIRVLEQQWVDYRHVMRENTAVYEEAAHGMGVSNYFVQKGLAARRELDGYVRQLADEQEEHLAETATRIRSRSESELDRLRQERAGASWV